jgi:hypothetical protein
MPPSPDRFRARHWVVACAVYAGLTAAITWPIAAHLRSALPHDAYDPALNTWILWWNAHAVPFTSRWWSAPFFWPMPGALALSELLLGISLLTTPLQWLGLGAVASQNLAFVAAFVLTALAAHALVFTITRRHDAGYIAGCAVAFSAYRIAHLAHIQVLWMFGVPLALLALHRYIATHRPLWLLAFAGAFLVQALSNGYLLLMFPVLVLLFIVWFGRTTRDAAAIGAATALTLLALAPIAWGYYHWQADLSMQRRFEEIEVFSADVTALVAVGPDARVWAPLSRFDHAEDEFFPGAVVALLIAIGVVAAFTDNPAEPRPRSVRLVRALCLACATIAIGAVVIWALAGPWTFPRNAASPLLSVRSPQKPATVALMLALVYVLSSRRLMSARNRGSIFVFYLLAALVMFLFALGPNPRFNGTPIMFHGPYWWLLQLPGFSGLRVPARFGALFVFCVATAAALAFAHATANIAVRLRTLLAVAASVVILIEAWPRMTVAELPPPLPIGSAGAAGAVLELPVGTIEGDTAALFRTMSHRLPLVNGYSGYRPIHYSILRRALEQGDERVLDAICRDRDLLVAVADANVERWSPIVTRHPRASLVAAVAPWHLYRITRAPYVHEGSIGDRLAIASAAASSQHPDVGRMLDANLDTWWSSGQPQRGGEELTVDLRDESFVTAVRLDLGPLPMEYPRGLAIDCADGNGSWQTCWIGSPAAAAVTAALEDPRTMPITLFIGRGGVRRLRLRQLGTDPVNAWAIAELSVYGTRAIPRTGSRFEVSAGLARVSERMP